jgi:hypothetical protein
VGTKDGTLVGHEFGKIVGNGMRARLGKVGNWVGARVEILVAMGGVGIDVINLVDIPVG